MLCGIARSFARARRGASPSNIRRTRIECVATLGQPGLVSKPSCGRVQQRAGGMQHDGGSGCRVCTVTRTQSTHTQSKRLFGEVDIRANRSDRGGVGHRSGQAAWAPAKKREMSRRARGEKSASSLSSEREGRQGQILSPLKRGCPPFPCLPRERSSKSTAHSSQHPRPAPLNPA